VVEGLGLGEAEAVRGGAGGYGKYDNGMQGGGIKHPVRAGTNGRTNGDEAKGAARPT
jgi:hypothetical protein